MARNATESPLLSLPAEILDMILHYVVTNQHIHIHATKLKPQAFYTTAPTSTLPTPHRAFHTPDKLLNTTFSLDWRAYYSAIQRARSNTCLDNIVPEERVV